MKFIKVFLTSLVSIVLLQFIFISCVQEPQPPLRLGINVWPGNEILFLADDLGYYKNTPIQLVTYSSNSELTRAYRNGEIEAVSLTLDQALLLAETTTNFRIVLVQDFSNGGDAIVAQPEIKNLRELKSRRVGVESTTLEVFILRRALGLAGMSPKDVQIISLLGAEDELPFKQGSIDAVVTYEPSLSNLLATGANLLFDSRQIPNEIIDTVVIRNSVLTQQPAVAQALIDGWFHALDYLHKHPQDAARRIAPHERVTPEQFLKSLNSIRIPDVEENQQILGKTDATTFNAVIRLLRFMQEKNLLKKIVEPASVFDARLVNKVEVSIFKN